MTPSWLQRPKTIHRDRPGLKGPTNPGRRRSHDHVMLTTDSCANLRAKNGILRQRPAFYGNDQRFTAMTSSPRAVRGYQSIAGEKIFVTRPTRPRHGGTRDPRDTDTKAWEVSRACGQQLKPAPAQPLHLSHTPKPGRGGTHPPPPCPELTPRVTCHPTGLHDGHPQVPATITQRPPALPGRQGLAQRDLSPGAPEPPRAWLNCQGRRWEGGQGSPQ